MVLSKRLLPRPESLQNTAINVSHLKGGQGKERESTNTDSSNVVTTSVGFDIPQHLSIYYKHPASGLGLGLLSGVSITNMA